MTKVIYLFKEHENFQPGKSKLQRAAVFKTNLIAILAIILILLGLLALIIDVLPKVLANPDSVGITMGRQVTCESVRESATPVTYLVYEYTVAGQDYRGRADARSLSNCWSLEEISIYYKVDNPEISSLSMPQPYNNRFEGITAFCFVGFMILFVLLFCLRWLLANLREQHLYQRFLRADTIFEATVTKTRTTTSQKFADYYFFNHDKEKLHGRIEARWNYKWPQDIEQGDILQVLYLYDEAFCVL